MAGNSSSARLAAVPVETRWLAAAAAASLCLAGIVAPADVSRGPVVCPFRRLTGLPCPGCGLTRSWVFVMHGRIGDAVAANPFGLVLLPIAAVFVVFVGRAVLGRRPPPDIGLVVRHPLGRVLLVGWLGFAVVRLIVVATGAASA